MRKCFLCGRNGAADRLERHHIFNGPWRAKSERYGLVVYLCGERCHRNGENAAHAKISTMRALQRYGQRKVMREQGWDTERFIAEFGKNYL